MVLSGVVALVALAWAYMVYLAQSTSDMGSGMAMAQLQSWSAADFGLMFLMWAVMMVAMMVPTAAPMICCSPPSTAGAGNRSGPTCRRAYSFRAT